jgi:hypothetical protein
VKRKSQWILLTIIFTACLLGFANSFSAEEVTDWAPLYPGAKVKEVSSRQAGVESYTGITLSLARGDCTPVFKWYKGQLNQHGFRTYAEFISPEDVGCTMHSDGRARTRSINAQIGNTAYDMRINLILGGKDGNQN